jgi:homoserine kinase
LGLALSLYTTIEITERTDESLIVEPEGEGAGQVSIGLRHPVVLSLIRMFQQLERAPLGINIKIDNRIPLKSGLGAESAFLVAGVIVANNLMGNPYSREEALQVAARFSKQVNGTYHADGALTAVLGGLTASAMQGERLIYRSLPIAPLKVVVVLPEMDDFGHSISSPERVPMQDAIYNLSRMPLLVSALQEGDLNLLAQVLDDKLHAPTLIPAITGYREVVQAAKDEGALAVTVSGDGPALLAFAEDKHDKIAKAMEEAFLDEDLKSRSWVLPVDTQGVVLSVMQSS